VYPANSSTALAVGDQAARRATVRDSSVALALANPGFHLR
jgi:hypothetical protein